MATFEKYTEDQSLAGPARMAVTAAALVPGSDPADITDVMDANYDFVSSPIDWLGVGATNGGIKVTAGFTEFVIAHDLSDAVRTALQDTSMAVETNLAETADFAKLRYAWLVLADNASTTAGGNSYVGLGARRSIPERSLVAVHCDQNGKLRIFYLRTVRNTAGDSQLNLARGALQEVPFNLRAFKDSTADAGEEFGGIFTEDGYGGVAA